MPEVVQQRLHFRDPGIHAIAIGNLAKKMHADLVAGRAQFIGDALPIRVSNFVEPPSQEGHDRFHATEPNPYPGSLSTHDWDVALLTIPGVGDAARKALADNLNRLMAASDDLKTIKQVSARSGVSTGTVDRLRRAEVSAGVDHLDLLARAFGVEPWEILKPSVETGLPFRDLTGFEVQCITLFRKLDADTQHSVLVALNDNVTSSKPSVAAPFKGERVVRGPSRFAELREEAKPRKKS